jgi:hypothetical protein
MAAADIELVTKLMQATETGRIDWQKTATSDRYAASFGGRWTVVIDYNANSEHRYFLALKDSEGQEVLRIWDDLRLSNLFESARRKALKIDEAIADVLKELDKT